MIFLMHWIWILTTGWVWSRFKILEDSKVEEQIVEMKIEESPDLD